MNETHLRQEVCRFGKMLYDRGLLVSTDGNLSARLNEELILCTPTSISKGMMEADDLVVVDRNGSPARCCKRLPSTEIGMHLLYYSLRPEIGAVVHAHPPSATGFAAADTHLAQFLISETSRKLGAVPVAPYGTPGTPELQERLKSFMADHSAILMGHHGAVTCGQDLLEAYLKMEAVEHYAKIAAIARQLSNEQADVESALGPVNVDDFVKT